MAGFRKAEVPREQLVLWSVKLDDALAADHPVRHLDYLLHRESFAETFREWARDYVLVEGQPLTQRSEQGSAVAARPLPQSGDR